MGLSRTLPYIGIRSRGFDTGTSAHLCFRTRFLPVGTLWSYQTVAHRHPGASRNRISRSRLVAEAPSRISRLRQPLDQGGWRPYHAVPSGLTKPAAPPRVTIARRPSRRISRLRYKANARREYQSWEVMGPNERHAYNLGDTWRRNTMSIAYPKGIPPEHFTPSHSRTSA